MAQSNRQNPDWFVDRIKATWKRSSTDTIEACRLLHGSKDELDDDGYSTVLDALKINPSTAKRLLEIGKSADRLIKENEKHGLPSGWGSIYYIALFIKEDWYRDAVSQGLIHPSVDRKSLESFYNQQKNAKKSKSSRPDDDDDAEVDFVTIRIVADAKQDLKKQILSDAMELAGRYQKAVTIFNEEGAEEFLEKAREELLSAFLKEYADETVRLAPPNLTEKEVHLLQDVHFQFRTWKHNEVVKTGLEELNADIKKLEKLKRRTKVQNVRLDELKAEKSASKPKKMPRDPNSEASIEHPDHKFSIHPRNGEAWTFESFLSHQKERGVLLSSEGIRDTPQWSRAWCVDNGIHIIQGTPEERAACKKHLEDTIRGKASAEARGNKSKAPDALAVVERLKEVFLWD